MSERPRERLAQRGPRALSDTELLAILIGTGRRGRSVLDLARDVLRDGLPVLASRTSIEDVGCVAGARIVAAFELGRRASSVQPGKGESIREASSLAPALIARYGYEQQEKLGAIYLDSRNRVVREREIYVGSLSSASVSTRDVFRFALEDGAASAVVFHNHPSGDPTPSLEDLQYTRALVQAGNLMNIGIIDHLIVARSGFVSMRKQGMM